MMRNKGLEEGEDRISGLPEELVFRIFSSLPVKTMARMSILSKRWRYLWHSFPNLDIGFLDDSALSQIMLLIQEKKKHSWDLRVLKITGFWVNFSRIEPLIQTALTQLDIQVLHLKVGVREEFDVPYLVFQSQSLISLRLARTSSYFRLPPLEIMLQGFRSLTEFNLQGARFKGHDEVKNLFTDDFFPSLKILTLKRCTGFDTMRIHCTGLQKLHIKKFTDCDYMKLKIIGPNLVELRFSICYNKEGDFRVKISTPALRILELRGCDPPPKVVIVDELTSLQNVVLGTRRSWPCRHDPIDFSDFFISISDCRSLIIETTWVEIMHELLRRDILCPFKNLEYIQLTVDGYRDWHNYSLAFISGCCPGIRTLFITKIGLPSLSPADKHREFLIDTQTSSILVDLMVLKIHGANFSQNDYSFIKFMINHAERLEEIHICFLKLEENQRDQIVSLASSTCIRVIFGNSRILDFSFYKFR